MSKELPYFKFEPAEYLTKDISFCSFEAQGLFINICCFYWQRECDLTLKQIEKRFNNPGKLQELIDEGIIDVSGDKIAIKFLDKQLKEVTLRSEINSRNGAKGGRPKKQNKTETKANGKQTESKTKGIREDKIREDKNIVPSFDDFWGYAKSKKPSLSKDSVKLKYDSWIANNWKDGNDKKITNWKSKLLNTIPYLETKEMGTYY